MDCTREVDVILLDIIARGILRIRANAGDPVRCVAEADHIHNLPVLLKGFTQALLDFYWDVERTTFLSQIPDVEAAEFSPLWDELQPHVGLVTEPSS